LVLSVWKLLVPFATIKYSDKKKVVDGANQNKKFMNAAKFSWSKQCKKKSSVVASAEIFSPYKDERNNYSTTAIEVTKNVSQHAEISCTHVEPNVQSSCDASTEHHVDTIDDASNGLSMLAQGVQSDGTTIQVKGQCSSIFQSQCKIQDKVCKLIIYGISFTNAISLDLVAALSLYTWRLSTPRYMQWMNQSDMLKITHKARVKFSIGNYIDTVDCDVAPLSTCHLLLGRPWQFDLDATHGSRRSNTYSSVHKGMSHVLKPMMKTAIKADIFSAVRKKKKIHRWIPQSRGWLCVNKGRMM
jgi:hypothetical protein